MVVAFSLALAARVALVVGFPTLYGGDAAGRLAHADTLVLGYQLPLPQLFVVAGKALHDDPILTRLIFCVWGGVLAAGLTGLLGRFVSSRSSLFGSVLFACDPLLIHYSIVPYQEPVAYGFLAWAFYFGAAGRPMTGAGLMGAACLSRYEAWLFLPAFLWITRSRLAALVAAAPVAGWISWWRGLAPSGLYVLDLDGQAERLPRLAFLGRKFIEYETLSLVLVVAAGFLVVLTSRNARVLKGAATIGAVIVVVVTLGHEYPPGSGLMSERLIHLPVILALSLSAIALARMSQASRPLFHAGLVAAFFFCGRSLWFETGLLQAAARDPNLALARDAARAIEAERGPHECVSVLAPLVEPSLLEAYIKKVDSSFGDVSRAREQASSLANESPDRDRIAAQLKAKTGTVQGQIGCPLLLIVDQAAGGNQHPEGAGATLLALIVAEPRRARLFRIRS
ncbi:MAG: hypothetical protein JJE39_02170 [Vicinamibacteria bacterium]|nr:hypothetical protein [Vicinamibacteria bacterium]